MAGSLKDQLLKAGLADAKKARQADHAKRQQAGMGARLFGGELRPFRHLAAAGDAGRASQSAGA